MPYDDVQKFSEAAVNKARLLKEHPGKYFLRAVMAGFLYRGCHDFSPTW